jgi:predicted AlkP superfamily pyrophosphatase or phosphodiesterase
MNCGPNIFDYLVQGGIQYHVSAPQKPEEANLAALLQELRSERIDFAFVYWPDLDGLLHRVGNQSPEIEPMLRRYEQRIDTLLSVARRHYEEVRLYVFSDHGMANCNELVDLQKYLSTLPVSMPQDFVAVFDSTMARFWFFNEPARRQISALLQTIPQGRIIPDEELEALGTLFPERQFGELIFLVKEGVLIVPSHMGERPICAMHGYHPCEKHSYAALCTNQPDIPPDIVAIPDVFRLMTRDADLASSSNRLDRDAVILSDE